MPAFHPFGFPLPDLTGSDKLRLKYSCHNMSVRNKNEMLTTMLSTKLLVCKLCQEKESKFALHWGSFEPLDNFDHDKPSSLVQPQPQ